MALTKAREPSSSSSRLAKPSVNPAPWLCAATTRAPRRSWIPSRTARGSSVQAGRRAVAPCGSGFAIRVTCSLCRRVGAAVIPFRAQGHGSVAGRMTERTDFGAVRFTGRGRRRSAPACRWLLTGSYQVRAAVGGTVEGTTGGSPVIRFDGVSKRYPDGTVAVDGLDLVAPAGEITVFVGPSGCGKTTSLRMVNRMVEPTAGRILLDDQDTAGLPVTQLRRGIGYVIQHAGLFPHRPVLENVATVPLLLGR